MSGIIILILEESLDVYQNKKDTKKMTEDENFKRIVDGEESLDVAETIAQAFGSLDFISYVILGSKFIGSDGKSIVYDRDRHLKAWKQMEKDFSELGAEQEKPWEFPAPPKDDEEEEGEELP